jgi:predicted ATPase
MDRSHKSRSAWADSGTAENSSSVAGRYLPTGVSSTVLGRHHVTALILNRLGDREINTIIGCITGNRRMSESVKHDIAKRTDGIPLFVEEMTKAILEADADGEVWGNTTAVLSPALSVPASLHASLMARLDRLGSAKDVAQVGAVIGREFSYLF